MILPTEVEPMSTVSLLEPGRLVRPNDDETLYEIVNGVKVYPRDEEADDRTVDGVRDDALYEVVGGVRVELPPMASRASHIKSDLGIYLGNHAKTARLGRVEVEGLFLIPRTDGTSRRPDVAFISYERWAREKAIPEGAAWPLIPDLAVEVVSPNDPAEAALAKIREYFDAGVRQVWAVYPELRVVHVFESFTTIRVVTGEGVLEGGEVVPGFRLPMATLFEDLDG
jgi:Uma2 family endonuclease